MFSHHITNCCNVTPPEISRKYRPACGREKLDGCNDGKPFKLQNTILDQIWSKPLWYQKRLEASRNIEGSIKPQRYEDYKNLIGATGFFPTDQFCEYSQKACDIVYTAMPETLWGKYDVQNKTSILRQALDTGWEGIKLEIGDPCPYPNCWISKAETDQASCGNQYYKLIAHYPSVGRPFQSPSSIKSEGLRNSNVTNDIVPGRQSFSNFNDGGEGTTVDAYYSIVQGSHRKDSHTNTAYPGKYWISWWNSIHPGNVIGFEGTTDQELFSNPFASSEFGPRKLSEQIKTYDAGGNPDQYTGAYKGFTFIKEFEKQASNEIIKLSTGFRHSCILTKDYKCFCWGENSKGQSTVPLKYKNGSVPVKDIDCGGEFTIVTLFNGSIDGWGDSAIIAGIPSDIRGPTLPPSGIFVKKVAAGGYHVVALMEKDVKTQPNGKKTNTKNTIRAWGNNTYGQTNIPVVLKTTDSSDFSDFIDKKNQDTIGTRPTIPDGSSNPYQATFSDIGYNACFKKDCILPWWPIISSWVREGISFGDKDLDLYTYSSLYRGGGLAGLVNEFENTKVPSEDTYPERITADIEFEDVWAGKYHTVGVTKNTIKVPNKKPNWKLHTVFLNWAKNNADEITTVRGISGWAPNGTLTVIPQTVLYDDIQRWGDPSEVLFSPGLGDSDKTKYGDWKTRTTDPEGKYFAFRGSTSVIETAQPSNIFFWGAGMQGMDHKVVDDDHKKAKESCNFDYEYHARYDRISSDGNRLRNVFVDPDNRYYIKTNSSSYDTIILGFKEGSINKQTTEDGRIVSNWMSNFIEAWGCGLGTKKYLHDPTAFPHKLGGGSSNPYPCNDMTRYAPPDFYEYTSLKPKGWIPAFSNYFYTAFVIKPENLNFRLNLYKLDANTFFQFKWNEARLESTSDYFVCPYGLNYGGWTLGTEQELNDTSVDYSEFNKLSTKNNIIIRTGGKGTYLIEKYVDEWVSTLPVKIEPREYTILEDGISNWTTVFSGATTTNFFEVGDNHLVSVSKYFGDGNFFNNPNSILNFPYKLNGQTEPKDVTGLGTFTTNGITEPTIPIYKGILNNKNNIWKQPKFDEETSSRLILNLNVTIKKTITNPDRTTSVSYLRFNTDNDQHFMLAGLRGDQRIKPFTGATCDCMWSDWATDNLKIGGHQGTIINDTTFYAHDKNKSFIPWDKQARVPDRTYKIDEQGIEKIHYYNAPPNVLTHTLIEIPPGRFPSQLAAPCRQKFCEGGVNRTIQNWCDPCFGYGVGKTLSKEIGKSIWPGRMGCTGCEYNYNLNGCSGCTFVDGMWACPSTSPKIHDVYGYNNLEYALGTTIEVEHKINSFGEFSTPIEEAWPSLNRYLIPRWTPPSVDGVDTKTTWILNSSSIQERTTVDYPLVVVPAHGGDIGPIYDLEAYQHVALSLSVGSIDEYANKTFANIGKGDRGVAYITDFKDTEYPLYRNNGIYPNFYSPNGSTGSSNSRFYRPPAGVTFDVKYFNSSLDSPGIEPLCGNTETGCSSCSIPFTGAEVASWGFDVHSESLVNAIQSFLPLSGDTIRDPEIGNIDNNGVWLGIARDRFIGDGESIKNRIRFMFPITLKEGETIKFGTGVRVNNAYSKTILNDTTYELFVSCSLGQYPNNNGKTSSTQKYPNYEYRWGRFNDECGCSSRMAINPDIFLAPKDTPTLEKLQTGKIAELTNKEKSSILIGGHETKGLGLLQYWNCTNTVTPLESGQSPHLMINNINVGLSDLTDRKPTFLSNTQGYLGSGADLTTIPMPSTHFYRGDYNLGFIHDGYYMTASGDESNVPRWRGFNSPGIRGIWSGWLSSKGWSNFFTARAVMGSSDIDDFKDRVGGDIPLESSHPQGWLGYGSTHPMMRNSHTLSSTLYDNTLSISSMTDFVSSLRNFDWSSSQYSGLPTRRSGIYATNTSAACARLSARGGGWFFGCSNSNLPSTNSRKNKFVEYSTATKGGKEKFEHNFPKFDYYDHPENPKTQRLKMCCFGNGFENEVYSSVTKSFIPDIYSKVVKINKYRNLYNAMWHSHPISLPQVSFRNWQGDPYTPDYCEPGSINCKTKYSPVWFEYWYPEKVDNSGSQGGAGSANPFGFNYNKHIQNFRHQRWDLPLFIGVNRDNIANFYIHDQNCDAVGMGPELCSGFEIVDKGFPTMGSLLKVGWDHRRFDSLVAQKIIEPNSLYFYKTNRGGAATDGWGPLTRGNVLVNPARTSAYRYAGTFYTINSDVWSSNLWESCMDFGDGTNTDTWAGLMGGLYGGIFVALSFGEINFCLRSDDSRWNPYFTYMGPGYVINNGFTTKNAIPVGISNIPWYNT
jgi:hypothetical protein